MKPHPNAEVRRRDIVVSRRKARKTAHFADLWAESSPLEPFRGLLSAATATHFDPADEREKVSSITKVKFEIS
ncbi:hypothetical protein [Methylosinus sp. sav-2]|uniref:hypothetical protein n=1 Tax=Methylosinus sp. sav-2 TaxID=2485168 RepID=UPI0010653E94|nr:hypothetical protein [Methylosinus sp. sav-2]